MAALTVLVALVTATAGAPRAKTRSVGWQATDLGAPAGPGYVNNYPSAVNDAAVIVGSAWGELAGGARAVRWQPLGVRWVAAPLGRIAHGQTEASDINNSGMIVGYVQGYVLGPPWVEDHPVVWREGKPSILPGLGGNAALALAANDRGQIVGWGRLADWSEHAILWNEGTALDLGTLPGRRSSSAAGLNDRGEIVGSSWNGDRLDSNDGRAFVWENGKMRGLPGLRGSRRVEALGINESGLIVGVSYNRAGRPRAVMWKGGRIRLLAVPRGATSSSADAVNDSGLIVGNYTKNGKSHALLWQNGAPVGLPALRSGGESGAGAVNSSGVIVGWSDASNGRTPSVAWTRRAR